MKCPYCNNEMSSGLLNGRGAGGLFWMPEGEKLPNIIVSEKTITNKNGIVFDYSALSGINYPAHVCKNCKKVIFEFE